MIPYLPTTFLFFSKMNVLIHRGPLEKYHLGATWKDKGQKYTIIL